MAGQLSVCTIRLLLPSRLLALVRGNVLQALDGGHYFPRAFLSVYYS